MKTPCQENGYEIGDIFEITNNSHYKLKIGDLVELKEDDNSMSPLFKVLTGTHKGSDTYITLHWLKKLGVTINACL